MSGAMRRDGVYGKEVKINSLENKGYRPVDEHLPEGNRRISVAVSN